MVHPLAIRKSLTKNIENLSACVWALCPPLSIEFTKRYIQLLSFSWAVRYECDIFVYGLRPSYCSAQFTSASMSCMCWRMWPGFSKGKCLLSNNTSTQPHLSSSTINQTELWNITEHTATLWPLCITTTAPNSCICACACQRYSHYDLAIQRWAVQQTIPPPPHPIARFKHHECRVNLALSHAPLFGPFFPVRGAVTYHVDL